MTFEHDPAPRRAGGRVAFRGDTRMKRSFLAALGLALLAGTARAADKNPIVVMETSMGTIKIELNAEKAPISTQNFLKYVEDKHYDGTIFHRVISDFMIQGGGFEPGMKEI